MADISQINLPNGSSYNVKDASALHNITVPEYDATSTYDIGDFVTYNGNIYMCIVYILEPEAWNSNNWSLVDGDQSYLHSLNPNGAGSFSLNRKDNTTIGPCSFTEGYNCTASKKYSHAEGTDTTASGAASHAEGSDTTASGAASHAEGTLTIASTTNSHAEGYYTTASGVVSHAEGDGTTASGYASHAEGNYTTANHKSQHTFGEYNVLDTSTAHATNRGNYIEIVGNGTAGARSNARTLDWSGNEVLAGRLKVNGTEDVPIIYEVTQSQYDALKQAGTLVHNALYVITDAQNLNATASDIAYDSNTTVKQKIDSKADTSSLSTVATSGNYNDLTNKPDLVTNYVRVGMGNAPKNIDDCVNGYVYWCNNTGGGETYTNAPGPSAYHIYTFKPISTHGFQMAIQFSGNYIYVRTIADNTWGAWKSVTLS